LVTIKTFARHLPALLEDADARARFATLCDEAVERMDGVLENVLAFARLGTPRREAVEVPALLDRVVAELRPELGGRDVHVAHGPRNGHGVPSCTADPDYLAYGLRNLLAGVAREVTTREQLVVDTAANGVVTLRFTTGRGAAERLRRLIGPGPAAEEAGLSDPTLLPLAFRLARSALERGGGTLEVVAGDGNATTVVVRLPTAAPTNRVEGQRADRHPRAEQSAH